MRHKENFMQSPNWINDFIALAEHTVLHLRRELELDEQLARLEPSCNTCTKGPERYACHGDTSPCATFEEIPDVAREREIAVAAFEAIGETIQ